MKRKRFSVEQIVAVLKQAEIGKFRTNISRKYPPKPLVTSSGLVLGLVPAPRDFCKK